MDQVQGAGKIRLRGHHDLVVESPGQCLERRAVFGGWIDARLRAGDRGAGQESHHRRRVVIEDGEASDPPSVQVGRDRSGCGDQAAVGAAPVVVHDGGPAGGPTGPRRQELDHGSVAIEPSS